MDAAPQTVEPPNAEESMFFLFGQGEKGTSLVMPNTPCHIENHGASDMVFSFPRDLRQFKGEYNDTLPFFLCVDYTNDPTPNAGGWGLSIGYYLLRFNWFNLAVVSWNPFTLKGKKSDLSILLNRPQKGQYEPLPTPVKPDTQMIFSENSDMIRDYLMPHNTWGNFHVIASILDDENKRYATIVEQCDFRDYFSPSVPISYDICSTRQEAILRHKALVEGWLKGKLQEVINDKPLVEVLQ